jgi:GxxExxY protein
MRACGLKHARRGVSRKVYENALVHELRKAGLSATQQADVAVWYDGVVVGQYSADIIVNNAVIVELKAVSEINDIHRAQCLNYFRATGFRLCLLMNFAKPRLEIKRIILGY